MNSNGSSSRRWTSAITVLALVAYMGVFAPAPSTAADARIRSLISSDFS